MGPARNWPDHLFSAEAVGNTGRIYHLAIVSEDVDKFLRSLAGFGNFLPEIVCRILNLAPLVLWNRAQFELRSLGPQLCLTSPVPLIAVEMTTFNAGQNKRPEMLGKIGPTPLIDKE
jgi:hypothetical protein